MDQESDSTSDDETVPFHLNIPEPVRLAPVISKSGLMTLDLSSENSNYKMLIPPGKFVNRRSPQKLKADIDLEEVRSCIYLLVYFIKH